MKSPIKYSINDEENLKTELSPTKIKISPAPQPSQYKRQHIFVEEGLEIFSEAGDDEEDQLQREVELIFEDREKGTIAESKGVEKPNCMLRKQTAKRRPSQQTVP